MDIALIAIRTVHFAGAISLAGLFGFVALIAGRVAPSLRERLVRIGWISIALLLASAPLWLLFVAQSVSADSLATTIRSGAIVIVLGDTQFGHVLILRMLLALLLLPYVATLGRRRALDLGATVIAAISLALIAWQGHAGADLGWDAAIHLTADATHLVAAGLWLGALLPFALLLRAPATDSDHGTAARRFSTLGLACVAVLLVSGTINAWYLVGSIPALIGTPYGQLLLAKLALVAAMLSLAAINRWRLVPRLASGDPGAASRIASHAAIEAMLGLLVIAIVAGFGTMIPAAHQLPAWPFPVRFSLAVLDASPDLRRDALFSGIATLAGLALIGVGIRRRRWLALLIGLALAVGLGARAVELLLVPATPTSYASAPEPFTAATIATGHALYVKNCVSCHGDEGRGDGPLGAELPIVPADLTAHLATHTEGDLYSFVTDGMDGGVMPSFAALDSTQRWDLVVFLDAQQQAAAASSTLLAEVTGSPAPRAPDFALPSAEGDAGSLQALAAQGGALLVFASLPQSQARLDQLRQWSDALRQAGIAVVTMTDAPAIRDAYALYERRPQLEDEAPAAHLEFLIDRDGYIRARWRPGDTPDWTQLPALQREIAAMTHLELAPDVAPTAHVHED
jgi:putative copper export protein/mono/diheme cytochrome c family protein